MKKNPPPHLSAESRRLWTQLLAEFELDDAAGQLLLQSVCESFDRLQEARKILKKSGPVVEDRFGHPKPHPACAIERDARNQMHSAMRLLKLAPDELES